MKSQVISGAKDIADILAGLVERQEDIFLQLMLRNGSLVGIGMAGGKITHLQCGAAEGRGVLPVLREIQAGDRLFTWPPRPSLESSPPPSIDEIFEALGGSAGAVRPSAGPVDMDGSAVGSRMVGNDELATAICPLLRPYIGPMTEIICREVTGAKPTSISRGAALEMVAALAKNLRDPQSAYEFKVAATEKASALFD